MSLIGLRPLLVDYLPIYNSLQAGRNEVNSIKIGWAQVNDRNSINWQVKFNYDVWYFEHITLALNIIIFWLTILKVLSFDGGVIQKEHVTIEKFTSN
jgi:undecaprenyl phosphate N,N'-diacetylbacillosamine 1-phosphate transferase